MVTWIFRIVMYGLFVLLKMFLLCCVILPLATWIFNTFMPGSFVNLKIYLWRCLMFTLVTWIFRIVMYGLFVLLKMSLLCCLILTLATRIVNILVDGLLTCCDADNHTGYINILQFHVWLVCVSSEIPDLWPNIHIDCMFGCSCLFLYGQKSMASHVL